MRIVRSPFALLCLIGILFALPVYAASFSPEKSRDFMNAVSTQFDAHYYPLSEYSGENAQMLKDVLTRFTADGSTKQYEFYVMESPEWNAFASAGMASPDIVCVLTGLLKDMKSPDELAGVVAHEIAHNNNKDAEHQLTKTNLSAAISEIVFNNKVTDDKDGEQQSIFVGFMTLGFSRKQESIADRDSLFMCTRAGYNPMATVALWDKMAAQEPGANLRILLDHPPSKSRADDLRKAVREHLRQQADGTWTVVSLPDEHEGSGVGDRLKRGSMTGLYSGGIGFVVEAISHPNSDKIGNTTLAWAGAGFAVGFLFDTDFPPTLRLKPGAEGERQYHLSVGPMPSRQQGCLVPGMVLSTSF